MNPVLILALVGGGYVLYQQSQGKSLLGGEGCPSKIEIEGAAFAREVLPGYENGGIITKAFNDAGIVVGAGGSFNFEDKKAGIKKFVSANYTKKLADKIFKKLVPSGCKKSDKETVVCMAIASVPNTDKVAMIEMHLPSFWILIHSTLIGTFADLFMTLGQLGEEGMEEKAAKCQTLIGKELEWWRKTMETEGDIPEDVVVKEVPKGDHKPAELPSHLLEGLLEESDLEGLLEESDLEGLLEESDLEGLLEGSDPEGLLEGSDPEGLLEGSDFSVDKGLPQGSAPADGGYLASMAHPAGWRPIY